MKKMGRFLRIAIATSIALVAILIAVLLPGCVTRPKLRLIQDPVHHPSTDVNKTDGHPKICDPVHPGPRICDPVHPGPRICDPVHTGPRVSPPDRSKQQK